MTSTGSNSYLYDGHSRRVKTTNANGDTYSMYSQSGQLLYRESDESATSYIFLGNKLIAKDGYSPEVADQRMHYKPFGETLETPKDDVGYTGHKFDADIGLSYMQARYYDPVIGRFMSNDPVGFRDVHSFNRFAYANNNPYRYIDPDGRITTDAQQLRNNGIGAAGVNSAMQTQGETVIQVLDTASDFANPVKGGIKRLVKNGLKGGCSFSPETLVLTKSGYKAITEIQAGDYVLAKNDETDELSWREVTATFKDWHKETITFTVLDENGVTESITTTAEHPFYLVNLGWVNAGEILRGDLISGPKSNDRISIVSIRINQSPQYAYNLTVDTDHTYFVGKTNMWVHNSCPFAKGVNAKSVKQFGHTFKTHGAGSKNTNKLKGRAAGTGQSQGQFLDNDKAAEFLADYKGITKPTTVDLPSGLGQVISPNGTTTPATKVLIVPKKGGGFKTAYPVEAK